MLCLALLVTKHKILIWNKNHYHLIYILIQRKQNKFVHNLFSTIHYLALNEYLETCLLFSFFSLQLFLLYFLPNMVYSNLYYWYLNATTSGTILHADDNFILFIDFDLVINIGAYWWSKTKATIWQNCGKSLNFAQTKNAFQSSSYNQHL